MANKGFISRHTGGILEYNRRGMTLWETALLMFVVLKLCDLVSWSWYKVFTPLWLYIAYYVLLTIVVTLWVRWSERRKPKGVKSFGKSRIAELGERMGLEVHNLSLDKDEEDK